MKRSEIVGALSLYAYRHAVRKGLDGIYSYSLFRTTTHEWTTFCNTGLSWGVVFIQPRYRTSRAGLFVVRYRCLIWRVIRTIAILFGPVSIPVACRRRHGPGCLYRLWFFTTHPLAESRRPYPASLSDVLAQFGGEDYSEDLTRLKSPLGNLGCGIPPLYKQYSKRANPAACSLSTLAATRSLTTAWDGLVLGFDLPEGESVSAVYRGAFG